MLCSFSVAFNVFHTFLAYLPISPKRRTEKTDMSYVFELFGWVYVRCVFIRKLSRTWHNCNIKALIFYWLIYCRCWEAHVLQRFSTDFKVRRHAIKSVNKPIKRCLYIPGICLYIFCSSEHIKRKRRHYVRFSYFITWFASIRQKAYVAPSGSYVDCWGSVQILLIRK